MKKAKKTHTPEQQHEAERLNAIFQARKDEFGYSQDTFARENGLKSQQVVWQYLHGYMPLNLAAAVKFAHGLLCSVSDFSPRIAKEIESLGLAQRPITSRSDGEQLTHKEKRLVELYRALGKEGKDLLSLWADAYLASRPPKSAPAQPFFSSLLASPVVTPQKSENPTKESESSTGASRNVKSSRKAK
jgi:hypothetical protein